MISSDNPPPAQSSIVAIDQPAADDERVIAALEEYVKAQEAGEHVDRAQFVAGHSDIAEVLAACLDGLDFVRGAGHQLTSSAGRGGAAALSAAGVQPLGDFRLIRELGRGGMGVVYEAEQLSLGRHVAVKVLPLAATLDPRCLQRFKNEVQAAAALHHTNIVPVYSVGCERGVHYYAMEFIQGQTLSELIRGLRRQRDDTAGAAGTETPARTALTTERWGSLAYSCAVARLGVQAAGALEHAHQLGVVHRDIKPSNLMLDSGGNVWVTDFGLARLPGDPGLTLSGDVLGTLSYMSPEQALAKRLVLDHRTDIYSLGATLYELLTLEPVFGGKDREELLRQVAFEEPLPPRRLNKAIAADLEAIVLKALEKNPSDRFASAQELADDLERHLKDEPIHARRPGVRVRLGKWARRHKPLVAGFASAAAILVIGLLVGAFWYTAERLHINAQIGDALAESAALGSQAQTAGREQTVVWSQAREAAARAKMLAQSSLADPALVKRVRALQVKLDEDEQDRAMRANLETARLPPLTLKGDAFDFKWSNDQYASAFRKYGIDIERLTVEEAAARVARRAISLPLVAALDDWAAGTRDMPRRQHLVQIARTVDRDDWRNQVRTAFLANDRAALKALSKSANVSAVPAQTVLLLELALRTVGESSAARDLLRRAQPAHAGDFWINYLLGNSLVTHQPRALAEAIRYFMVASALRPDSVIPHNNLGNVLAETGQWDAAIAQYREALRLKEDYPSAHANLGNVFKEQGKLVEAIREYREAIRLDKDLPGPHCNLGSALTMQGELDEGIAELRQAIHLLKDFPEAHYNLGSALAKKGRLDEAIAEFEQVILLNKALVVGAHNSVAVLLERKGQRDSAVAHYADAHCYLAGTLHQKGDLKGAVAEYRAALRLRPDDSGALHKLGLVLLDQGDLDAAIVAFREAVRLKKGYAMAHSDLGLALAAAGHLDEAIAEYRQAAQLEKDSPLTYFRLANAFKLKGEFHSALEAVRRGGELGASDPHWRLLSPQLLRQLEHLMELGDQLPGFFEGKLKPASPAERIELAELCTIKHFHAAAAQFYEDAFSSQPGLLGAHRYKAVCAAALAGCGQGKEVSKLDEPTRARFRAQALHWLREQLGSWAKQQGPLAPAQEQHLRQWQRDRALAGVRDADALAKLPATEQRAWRDLWADVANMVQRSAKPAGRP